MDVEKDAAQKTEEIVKTIIPTVNIFFLP